MDSSRELLRSKLVEKFTQKLDEAMQSPTVTMTDIENVVSQLQRDMGREVAEGLLALKKRQRRLKARMREMQSSIGQRPDERAAP